MSNTENTESVTEVINEDVAAAPIKAPRRKALWITAGAVVAALVVAAAIATPQIVQAVELSQAQESYSAAEKDAAVAATDLTAAKAELAAAQKKAGENYAPAKAILDAAPAAYVADAKVLDDYKVLLTDYAKSAELKLDDALNLVVVEETAPKADAAPAKAKAPTTASKLNAGADSFEKRAKADRTDAKALRAKVSDIKTAFDKLPGAQDAIVASAHKKGAAFAPKFAGAEKSTQASRDAFAAALANIDAAKLTADSDRAALIKTYVAAYAAVTASHAATVEAEKKAAEEAQRKQNGWTPGKSTPGKTAPRNGSSTPPSSGTGGGTPPTGGSGGGTPTPKRGAILKTDTTCANRYGGGGSRSANWTSNLVIPHDAIVTNVNDSNPGGDWSVTFSCF